MKFSTVVPVDETLSKIDYDSKIVSLGSCFAVNMAQKFKRFQFKTEANPFGILFHPLAIQRLLEYAITNYEFSSKDVFLYNEIWSCFDAHSDMNELEEGEVIENLNDAIFGLSKSLKEATHVFLTFGTAWVYERKEDRRVVANCHKVVQDVFEKRLLSYEEILKSYHEITRLINALNPEVQIVFTVSPVRHIKDSFVGNQRSKAHLIGALHQFIEEKKDPKCSYFPAYELVMDELRDYRFYDQDMLHPNQLAIDYIWERFLESFISLETRMIMKKVEEVTKAMEHRPFNPTSEQHLKFMDSLIDKIDFLLDRYPFMNFR